MKRWAILCLAAAMVGCGADEASRQHTEVAQELDEALSHMEKATSGMVEDARDFSGTLEEYQRQQLDEAATVLKPVRDQGTPTQQMASRLALAEVQASRGRELAREAGMAWARQVGQISRMLSTLTALRRLDAQAGAYAGIDLEAQLEDLKAETRSAANEVDQLEKRIEELQGRIDQLEKQKQQFEQKRRKQLARATDLDNRAFEAAGQMQYDLSVQASESRRQAGAAAAEADRLDARLDMLQSRIELEQTKLKITKQKTEDLRTSVRDLQERATTLDQRSATLDQEAGKKRDKLVGEFQDFAAALDEQVSRKFSGATGHFNQASEILDRAAANAPSGHREVMVLEKSAKQAMLGHVLQQQRLVLEAYQTMIEALQTDADSLLPEAAPAIQEAADRVAEQIATVEDQATQSFGQAAASLKEMAEQTRAEDMKLAAYRQIVSVHQALANLTGEMTHAEEVRTYQMRIDELTAGE